MSSYAMAAILLLLLPHFDKWWKVPGTSTYTADFPFQERALGTCGVFRKRSCTSLMLQSTCSRALCFCLCSFLHLNGVLSNTHRIDPLPSVNKVFSPHPQAMLTGLTRVIKVHWGIYPQSLTHIIIPFIMENRSKCTTLFTLSWE